VQNINKDIDSLILIDGNSLINRAFFALPPMSNSDGIFTNAVLGFINMTIKLIGQFEPKYIVVAFDLKGPTFRHKDYADYKGTRKGMPDELAMQLPILKNLLKTMHIATLELSGFEADDLIGTFSKKNKNVHSYIVTADRDCLQLVDDNISVVLTKKGISEIDIMDALALTQQFGLTPQQIIDYKALCGDASDNIPGVAGIGDKTAVSLLQKYNSLDQVYNSLQDLTGSIKAKLTNGRDMAYLSYKLAKIDVEVPIDLDLSQAKLQFPFDNATRQAFKELSFFSILKKSELFVETQDIQQDKIDAPKANVTNILSLEQLKDMVDQACSTVNLVVDNSNLHINFETDTEFVVDINSSMWSKNELIAHILPLFSQDKRVVSYNVKALFYMFQDNKLDCEFDDVRLMQYLIDFSLADKDILEFVQFYNFDQTQPAYALSKIRIVLNKKLADLGLTKLYNDIELPLIRVLYDMEARGFAINIDWLLGLQQAYTSNLELLSVQIKDLAGTQFNVQSPKQLSKVLFEDMKLKYPMPKPKSYSTAADILKQVEDNTGIIDLVLKYRELSKLNSTYVEGLLRASGAGQSLLKHESMGVVHTNFVQMLVATGRLSSVEPNLQNIPVRSEEGRNLRKAFVARENYMLICADYSQIELRLLAHLSQDKILVQAFKYVDDIHAITASQVFGVDLSDVSKLQRHQAKAVNFGIVYGISDFGLAQDLKISTHMAKQYIQTYFDKYNQVKAYLDSCVAIAKQRGAIKSIMGRIRNVPELKSSKQAIKNYGERIAMKMPMQGSASDIIKIAMLKVHCALKDYDAYMIHQVHDELIVECNQNQVEQVSSIIKACMQDCVQLLVPLTVDTKVLKQWQ
jgi:DNA polymerase-1